MASGPDELSRRAHDTADAHRRVAKALRARAEADRRVAQAFIDLAEAQRREADADPNPHTANTRRFQAGLSERHARILRSEMETGAREADTEQRHAETADARSAAALGGNALEG